MRTINFAKRNLKELVRDPLSFIFSIILPLFLLVIFKQFNIPSEVYALSNFTPGIVIFSFAFISLFVASLVAKDRSTSLLTRLYSSPMKACEYILGYTLSLIPIILVQCILFFIVAILLGLSFSINIIYTILALLPISLLFIFLGIFIGSFTSERASSGVGSVVVQLVAFTSGMYFDASMVSKVFAFICDILPFKGSLNIAKGLLNNTNIIFSDILVVVIYTLFIIFITAIIFKKKMTSDKK